MSSPCKTVFSSFNKAISYKSNSKMYKEGYIDPDELDKVTFDDIEQELDFDVNSQINLLG